MPGSRGSLFIVFAATIIFAPSRAARNAIANPIPRDAPVILYNIQYQCIWY